VGLGKDADSVQVLWVGAPPKQGFRGLLPVADDTGERKVSGKTGSAREREGGE
jgi:hypothetical protein